MGHVLAAGQRRSCQARDHDRRVTFTQGRRRTRGRGLGRARRGGGVVPKRRAGRCGRTHFKVRSRGARTGTPSATGSGGLLHRNRVRSRPRARRAGRPCPGGCVSPPSRHTAPGRDCRPGARDPTTPSTGSARGGRVRRFLEGWTARRRGRGRRPRPRLGPDPPRPPAATGGAPRAARGPRAASSRPRASGPARRRSRGSPSRPSARTRGRPRSGGTSRAATARGRRG